MELARFSAAADGQRRPDNPDQRIQEDLNLFTTYTISLSMGVLNAVVTLVSFVGILWTMSGASASPWAARATHPRLHGLGRGAYCLVGSVLARTTSAGRRSNSTSAAALRGHFRHHMVRVREYSESIALDHGEAVERGQLDGRFTHVLANYLNADEAQKNLIWFTRASSARPRWSFPSSSRRRASSAAPSSWAS
jgi:putative ATP-binding cassette transporter